MLSVPVRSTRNQSRLLECLVESLQSYIIGGWDYVTDRRNLLMVACPISVSLCDAVSSVAIRGCHEHPYSTKTLDKRAEKSSNFFKVLSELVIV